MYFYFLLGIKDIVYWVSKEKTSKMLFKLCIISCHKLSDILYKRNISLIIIFTVVLKNESYVFFTSRLWWFSCTVSVWFKFGGFKFCVKMRIIQYKMLILLKLFPLYLFLVVLFKLPYPRLFPVLSNSFSLSLLHKGVQFWSHIFLYTYF